METINELAIKLSDARIAEANAKEARIAVEEAIIAQLADLGESERRTVKTDVGLKLTVQTGLTYSVDLDGLNEEAPELAEMLVKVKESFTLDSRKYEALRDRDPLMFSTASRHVTTKPKKTSVALAVM